MTEGLKAVIAAFAANLALGPGAAAVAGGCAGEIATASAIAGGETVTLNCGGGADDPLQEALVVFTNGAGSEPAAITVCEVAANAHPGAPGDVGLDRTLTVDVTFQDAVPGNEDSFFMRVLVPFDEAALPIDGDYGPEATELAYYRDGAWVPAVTGNTVNSPGFGGTLGDRTTVVGTVPPAAYSTQIGDYGAFWHPTELRGFVWANVDHAGEFIAAAPLCRADVDGNGVVDGGDLTVVATALGGACTTPPIGCAEDVFLDGVIDLCDLAAVLAFWEDGACFLPPDAAGIVHSAHQVDNSGGDAEWGPGSAFNTHLTWDLRVAVGTPGIGDSWTASQAFVQLDDPVYGALSFYQHDFDGEYGAAPTTGVCMLFPAAEFDSYYIEATDVNPCTVGNTIPGAWFGFEYAETDTELAAGWIDLTMFDPPATGSPPFTIARYTLVVDVDDPQCPACHLDLDVVGSGTGGADPVLGTIAGVTTHRYGTSNLLPFALDIVDRCAADIDEDGGVGIEDFLAVLAAWPAGFGTPADLDRDGNVGIEDFLMVLAGWGPCSPGLDPADT